MNSLELARLMTGDRDQLCHHIAQEDAAGDCSCAIADVVEEGSAKKTIQELEAGWADPSSDPDDKENE